MSNVRRQTVIIAVLIVLIACAGWFAKVYSDGASPIGGIEQTNGNGKEATDTAVFFSETRISRENERSSTMQQLEDIIKSADANEESKATASTKFMELMARGDQENEVELKVKNDGYTDALCFITDNGVELYVKVSESLTKDEVFVMQDIIVRTTGIAPSNIIIKGLEE